MEGYALRTAVRESNRSRRSRTWVRFIRTAKAPELPVILLEDFGALIGLVFALFGVSMTLITGDGRWDAGGTAMIGLLLVVIAVSAGRGDEVAADRRERQPRAPDRDRERAARRGRGVGHPHAHPPPRSGGAAGRRQDRGDCDVVTAGGVAQAIDAAERRVRSAVPIARVIYLEPDLRRTDDVAADPGDTSRVEG